MSASLPFTVMPCPCCGSIKIAISTTTNALTNLPRNDRPVCLECGVRAETLEAWNRRTTRPEALRNQIIDECAKAINKRTEQLCSDPEVCYQESDTGATVINSRYSDHVEALDEAEAIVLALKTIPSPLARITSSSPQEPGK